MPATARLPRLRRLDHPRHPASTAARTSRCHKRPVPPRRLNEDGPAAHAPSQSVFDEDGATKHRGERHSDVENDGRATLSPSVSLREGLKVHARRIEAEKESSAPKELVDIAAELTMENYVEGSVGVSAHHKRHDRRNHFGVSPRRVIEPLDPTELGPRQCESEESAANDRDDYVSSSDHSIHIANAGKPIGLTICSSAYLARFRVPASR